MEIINNITNGIEIFQKLIIENNNVFEYSTKIVFEHYIILILAFLPFLFRLFFWLYVIQLKEYRWDRFKEYINTPQGNSALINMWSIIEFILLIISFYTIFNKIFEIIILPVFFYFLIIQNIFILRKIIKNRVFVPKITSRLILTFLLLSIPILFGIYIICYFDLSNYLYTYLMSLFIFLPFIIFIILIITLPLVNYKKNKIIKKAIEISNTYNNPIKIGITGSYGKSSVKEYLASILEQQGNTLKTPDNINTELGVSQLIINKLNDKYKYFVAEMGAYRIGEIDLLGKIVNHKHGFLTAIGNQHLGLFGTLENIKKGKCEIINSIKKNNGTLYVNWNNPEIRKIDFGDDLDIIKYGNYEGSDTKFEIIGIIEGKTKFTYEYNGAKTIFFVPLIGEHNIINISGVIAFGYNIGLKTSDLNSCLKYIKAPKNTLSTLIPKENLVIIDDTYNLSEAGLLSGIEVLNSFEGKKILVMDDILELGGKAKMIHFELGKKIAENKIIDDLFYIGVNYKSSFIKGLVKGGFEKKSIINKINIKLYTDKCIILFEGRNAGKYMNNLIKNV